MLSLNQESSLATWFLYALHLLIFETKKILSNTRFFNCARFGTMNLKDIVQNLFGVDFYFSDRGYHILTGCFSNAAYSNNWAAGN
jgi:hypothetical protein